MNENFDIINDSWVIIKFLHLKLEVWSYSSKTNLEWEEWIKCFISYYLNWSERNLLEYLGSEESKETPFELKEISQSIELSDLKERSWKIADSKLSPWQSIFLFNVLALFNKVTLTNSMFSILLKRRIRKVLNNLKY